MIENIEEIVLVNSKIQKMECLSFQERNDIKRILDGAAQRIMNGYKKPVAIVATPEGKKIIKVTHAQEGATDVPKQRNHNKQGSARTVYEWFVANPGSTAYQYIDAMGLTKVPYNTFAMMLKRKQLLVVGKLGKAAIYVAGSLMGGGDEDS
jgi:hypothetical protein